VGIVALADFGSTYTKVTLVERSSGEMLARAQAPTSTATDLMDGYETALAEAMRLTGVATPIETEIAASSAGGGLRVAAIGLAADLTAAAAQQAALNAGARVCLALAGNLGEAERLQLEQARAEIILFAGGTDGGQRDLVLANARQLAASEIDAFVVVACNAGVAAEVTEILTAAGHGAEVAANVMPALGRLEIEAARESISRAFLEHVIRGKGLSARPRFEQMVKMPTPEAVLNATHLLSRGVPGRPGVGDVIVVDVGGATTDVHSDRAVEPALPGIEDPLLPAPLTRRTVEGDLGLRAGAPGAIDVDGTWLVERLGDTDRDCLGRAAARRSGRPEWIPDEEAEVGLDRLLAVGCVTHALNRHCGTMLLSRGDGGPPTLVRSGPDLREVSRVIGTGGILAHGTDGDAILHQGLERRAPRSLSPRQPQVEIDRNYVLAAAGLLGSLDPHAALSLMRRELLEHEQR
jgi:uncharacterized protein (TIGR01319 family)